MKKEIKVNIKKSVVDELEEFGKTESHVLYGHTKDTFRRYNAVLVVDIPDDEIEDDDASVK